MAAKAARLCVQAVFPAAPVMAFALALAMCLSFNASAAPKLSTLSAFKADGKGEHPWASPILGPDGSLYGTTYESGRSGVGTVYRLKRAGSGAWKRTVLHQFRGASDGAGPIAGLVRSPSGALYGATESGGRGECSGGCGVVYELAPGSGGIFRYKVIHRFSRVEAGVRSSAQLVLDAEGALYGTTTAGGAADMGTVFRLAPNGDGWRLTNIHEFEGGKSDGQFPQAGVVFGPDGALYGTTKIGGAAVGSRGTVYRLGRRQTGGWRVSLIHAFTGADGGEQPLGPVVFDQEGALYGTTSAGGGGACFGGCGTVFRLKGRGAGRWTKTRIHSFVGGDQDGASPRGGLVVDAKGALWGMTPKGGANPSVGVVYRLRPPATSQGAWRHTVAWSFKGVGGEGGVPFGDLTLDPAAGVFYGSTRDGGDSSGSGTVFRLTP